MSKPGSTSGSNLAQKIFDQVKGSSPGTWDLKNTDEALAGFALHELRATNMASAYVEAAFHTFRPDVDWLRATLTVGNKIGAGIDNYFGNPRFPPCPNSVPLEGSMSLANRVQAADAVGSSDRSVPTEATPSASLEAAYRRALAGTEGSVLGAASARLLNSVMLTPDGLAIVDLGDLRGVVANGSTTFVRHAMLTEMNAVAFADPAVSQVEYRLNGSCSTFWAWTDGGLAGAALDRRLLATIRLVAGLAGVEERGNALAARLTRRLDALQLPARRSRVALVEWLSPLFAPGHWVPEQVERAGGVSVIGEAGERSRESTVQARHAGGSAALAPDQWVVIVTVPSLPISTLEAA